MERDKVERKDDIRASRMVWARETEERETGNI
jgi:hypothetical protein